MDFDVEGEGVGGNVSGGNEWFGKDIAGCELISERLRLRLRTKHVGLSIFQSSRSDHIFTECD